MQININSIVSFKQNYNNKKSYNTYPNLAPLNKDTVSFGLNNNKHSQNITTPTTVEEFKKNLNKPVDKATTEEIFNALNLDYEKDEKDNLIILNTDYQPGNYFDWKDLDIDENKLFKDIKEIKGEAYFGESNASNLGNLEMIGENASFYESPVTNLGNLKVIGGDADFFGSPLSNLGNLKNIKGNADFNNSNITGLSNLETIEGNAYFDYSPVIDLGKLKQVHGDVLLKHSKLLKSDFNNVEVKGEIIQ